MSPLAIPSLPHGSWDALGACFQDKITNLDVELSESIWTHLLHPSFWHVDGTCLLPSSCLVSWEDIQGCKEECADTHHNFHTKALLAEAEMVMKAHKAHRAVAIIALTNQSF